MTTRTVCTILALGLCVLASPAEAYVGPGAGVTLIGAAIGLIVAVVVAIGVVVLWPLRRMMKGRKRPSADVGPDAATTEAKPD